jgi:hypothetical protein
MTTLIKDLFDLPDAMRPEDFVHADDGMVVHEKNAQKDRQH